MAREEGVEGVHVVGDVCGEFVVAVAVAEEIDNPCFRLVEE